MNKKNFTVFKTVSFCHLLMSTSLTIWEVIDLSHFRPLITPEYFRGMNRIPLTTSNLLQGINEIL